MMVYRGGQSPLSPKGPTWHAAQYINYGSGRHTHMPQLILFLQKLIHGKNCRRPPIYPKEFIQEGVKDVPLQKRCTQRRLAMSMGVSKTTVHHWIVASTICVHCNSLKPFLTEVNKVARLLMELHFRDSVDPTKYCDMLDRIHLDEKWFFLTQEKEISLLLPEEKNPKCCVKHMSHITKVMFLCAIAQPRFNPSANSWWDGKLGIWPVGDWEPVKHKSKNRLRGTLVWKNKVVTKEVYRELLIQVVTGYHREVAPDRQAIKKNLHTTRWCKKSYW